MNGRIWLVVAVAMAMAIGAPVEDRKDLDKSIEDFLGSLYDRFYGVRNESTVYDQMQGDQPDNNVNGDWAKILSVNFSSNHNFNISDYIRTSRDRHPQENDLYNRDKDNWIQVLKENILRQIGRSNMTSVKDDNSQMTQLNMSSIFPNFLNSTIFEDDHITEKIRSYYPSCERPSSMDDDMWQDDRLMNLYFNNFDYNSNEKGLNIATATLRLYRIPSENSTKTVENPADCDSSVSSEEDRLLRVSIYWYTRSMRKKQVKRRLSDSKVIQENSRWVELSVKPATRAWSRGRNLGLAVQVEDQEGNILKADRLFKGALCMVGASTPKPIPTIIVDAARRSNEFDQRIHGLLGRNTTSSIFGDIPMLPTIDICTLEFPENYSQPPPHIANLRINACNLKKTQDQAQMLAERDKFERLATLPELLPNNRHIRHQRQHLKHNDFDPRSNIVNKRILTSEEVQALNLNITTVDR